MQPDRQLALVSGPLALVLIVSLLTPALASSGGGGLPWESRYSKSNNRSPARLLASSRLRPSPLLARC